MIAPPNVSQVPPLPHMKSETVRPAVHLSLIILGFFASFCILFISLVAFAMFDMSTNAFGHRMFVMVKIFGAFAAPTGCFLLGLSILRLVQWFKQQKRTPSERTDD